MPQTVVPDQGAQSGYGEKAMEVYLTGPKLRSEAHKNLVEGQMRNHLSKWLHTPLDEITKDMCVSSHVCVAKTGKRGANHMPMSVTGKHDVVSHHERLREPMAELVAAFKHKDLI
jgi:hypothetical protein